MILKVQNMFLSSKPKITYRKNPLQIKLLLSLNLIQHATENTTPKIVIRPNCSDLMDFSGLNTGKILVQVFP